MGHTASIVQAIVNVRTGHRVIVQQVLADVLLVILALTAKIVNN